MSTPDIYSADKKIDFAKKTPVEYEPRFEEMPKPEVASMATQAPVEAKAVVNPAPEPAQTTAEPVFNENVIPVSAINMPQEPTITNKTTSIAEEPRHVSIASSSDVASATLPRHSKDRSLNGAFSQGPGLTGPAATVEPDEGQHQRMTSAESMLDPKTRSKLAKEEGESQFLNLVPLGSDAL